MQKAGCKGTKSLLDISENSHYCLEGQHDQLLCNCSKHMSFLGETIPRQLTPQPWDHSPESSCNAGSSTLKGQTNAC